jgi:hypothetical protein
VLLLFLLLLLLLLLFLLLLLLFLLLLLLLLMKAYLKYYNILFPFHSFHSLSYPITAQSSRFPACPVVSESATLE